MGEKIPKSPSWRREYWLGLTEDEDRLLYVSVPYGDPPPGDSIEGISVKEWVYLSYPEALEFWMTHIKGWPTKTAQELWGVKKPKKNHDVLYLLLAYNFRLMSKGVESFLKNPRN